MPKLLAWLAVAWCVPAFVATALGWRGVWGTGPALLEYLTPIPVAAGVMHLPSLFAVTVVLVTQPWPRATAGYVRGLLALGSALALVMLLDLRRLDLVLSTDLTDAGRWWQPSPGGLFLLSDTLLAQCWLRVFGGREPQVREEWLLPGLSILVGVPMVAALLMRQDPRHAQAFLYAGSQEGPGRGDETLFVYTRLDPAAANFEAQADAYAEAFDPAVSINAEDVAVRFHTSLAAASERRATGAARTLCLYEDGTPAAWLPADGDCFSAHVSFSERLSLAYDTIDSALPLPVRSFLARRRACADVPPERAASVNPPCHGLDGLQAELARSHAGDPAVASALARER